MSAAMSGDLQPVPRQLFNIPDSSQRDVYGNNVLHYLGVLGDVATFERHCRTLGDSIVAIMLVEYNREDCLPIHLAVAFNNVQLAKKLSCLHGRLNPDDFYRIANRSTKTSKTLTLMFLAIGMNSDRPFGLDFDSAKQIMMQATGSTSLAPPPAGRDTCASDDTAAADLLSTIVESFLSSSSLHRAIQVETTAPTPGSSASSGSSKTDCPRLLSPNVWIRNLSSTTTAVTFAVRYCHTRTLLRILQYNAELCPTLRQFELNSENEWYQHSILVRLWQTFWGALPSDAPGAASSSSAVVASASTPLDKKRSRPSRIARHITDCTTGPQFKAFQTMFAGYMLSTLDAKTSENSISTCVRSLLRIDPIVSMCQRSFAPNYASLVEAFALNRASYFARLLADGLDSHAPISLPNGTSATLVSIVADLFSSCLARLSPEDLSKSSTDKLLQDWCQFFYYVFFDAISGRNCSFIGSDDKKPLRLLAQIMCILRRSTLDSESTDLWAQAKPCLRLVMRRPFESWLGLTLGIRLESRVLDLYFFTEVPHNDCCSRLLDILHSIHRRVSMANREHYALRYSTASVFPSAMFPSNPFVSAISSTAYESYVSNYFVLNRPVMTRPNSKAFLSLIRGFHALDQYARSPRGGAIECELQYTAKRLSDYLEWSSLAHVNGFAFVPCFRTLAADLRHARMLGGASMYGNAVRVELDTSMFGTFDFVVKTSQGRQTASSHCPEIAQLCNAANFPAFSISLLHDYLIGRTVNAVRPYAPCIVYTLGFFAGPFLSTSTIRTVPTLSKDTLASLYASCCASFSTDSIAYETITPFTFPLWIPESRRSDIGNSTLFDYLLLATRFCDLVAPGTTTVGAFDVEGVLTEIEYDLCSVVVQLISTLSVLNQWCSFVHYDLKHDNVLLEDCKVRHPSGVRSDFPESPFIDLWGLETIPSMADTVRFAPSSVPLPSSARFRHRCGSLSPVAIDFGLSHVSLADALGSQIVVGVDYMPLDQGVACANFPGQDAFFILSILYRFTPPRILSRLEWIFAPFQPLLSWKSWWKIPADRPEYVSYLRMSPRTYLEYLQRACPERMSGLFISVPSSHVV